MSHVRRGFVDVLKVAPQDRLAAEVIERIGRLYAVEEQARKAGLSHPARLALRQSQSVPVMAALKARLAQIRQQIVPGAKLDQACRYALGQWDRLERFLQDGQVEIDNNWCEGGMRPVALGRNYAEVAVMLSGLDPNPMVPCAERRRPFRLQPPAQHN